ncbi:MAG TPA: glycoside hydrolase family 125 protein, partial [Candidatus Limnocylindrales bacterium]|nr:glycoside hydrolase family 125 protein [Candidatus Limnocylindrales bacterium]
LALDPRGAGRTITAAFLHWCFETAERVDGWWPRASLASGVAKDPVFQLDQQLYPLLLLEDLARLAGDDAPLRAFRAQCDRVIAAILEQRTAVGLVATAETPADDPIDAPFHFSSHVLLWRVLRDLDRAHADAVRAASLRHFAVGETFAYAVRGADGEGAVRYHDANDLPTVFAPGWGFCEGDDPRWRATIAFAWSRENRGFIDGPLGGLGSVHTLHPWPLGDLQEIVIGRVMRDRARVARARARLRLVSTWDGLLPEAYDESTGAVASRHWFAWPIALWALLEREPALTAP